MEIEDKMQAALEVAYVLQCMKQAILVTKPIVEREAEGSRITPELMNMYLDQ